VKSVEVDARQVRAVSDSLEPAVKQAQRPIAGKKSRNQQNRAAVAVRYTAPAKDGIPPERVQLTKAEGIPEPHSLGW
jgi:hypothetical protein